MKFNEDKVLVWVENYIRATYDAHYSKNKIQTTEFVFDADHGCLLYTSDAADE